MKRYEQMSRERLIEELRRKDDQLLCYRSLFMSMEDAFFLSEIVYDDSGAPCNYRHIDVNPAFESLLSSDRDHIVGKCLNDVVPNYSPAWMQLFLRVATSGVATNFCYYCEPLRRHLEIFASRPAPDRYAVLIRDVTERMQAEQALQLREGQLRLFIEHAPVSLAMFDLDMRYICASRRWMECYLLGDADLTGMSHYDVFPEIPERWREAHRRGLSGEVLSCDGEPFCRSDGIMQWLRWKIHPWYDASGEIGGIVLFTEDTTDLKQAEEALRTSEQRYRDIVENQTEFVDRYLPGGILTFVNNSLASKTGRKPEELLGKSFYPFVIEEDREEMIRTIESLSAERPSAVLENRVPFPDGMRWMQWKHCALTDEAGKIIEYQATGRDITDLKLMQDELIRHRNELKLANELLEQRVRERTAELEAAIRAQESFSYSVSHDLRAPLRHINSFSAMLIEDYGDRFPVQAREYLDRICAASNRMGALIDHLLELSRVTRVPVNPRNVDLSELAASVLRMYQETEPGRAAEVHIEPEIKVMGDASLLTQLLENLLGNAWKYTARKDVARIQFGRRIDSSQEAYFVRDNGAGFDMKYSEKLFNPFERLHGPEFEGVGIGLATAQRIVQRHGGTIWAEGAVGQGAVFYFTLSAS